MNRSFRDWPSANQFLAMRFFRMRILGTWLTTALVAAAMIAAPPTGWRALCGQVPVGNSASPAAHKATGPALRAPAALEKLRVGDADPNYVVVPTNQVLTPLGQQVAVGG